MKTFLLGLTTALLATAPLAAQPLRTPAAAEPSWKKAEAEIAARRAMPGATARAKNVILFIGDGMGITTVTAARIFEAQQRARAAGGTFPGFAGGEENLLAFERFPNQALVKTYNTNAQVPDSAGTASAMTTGTKTRIGVLGMLPGQVAEDCRKPETLPRTLAELARSRGMGVGVVTTTRITHATPAAMYAHSPARDWEGNDRAYAIEARKSGCIDIASQLVAFPGGMDVVLGGGLSRFRPPASGGIRDDGRDLISEWTSAQPGRQFVGDAGAFRALDPTDSGAVLGLFNPDHLDFNFDADRKKEPALSELATFAVRKLEAQSRSKGRGGYVLMVEGGRIDHAHHLTNAFRALDETVEFAKAIEAVARIVDPKETLILVTADHSHVFTMAGYPPRGNDILGFLKPIPGGEGRAAQDAQGNVLDQLGRPVTTLGYANGPIEVRAGARTLSSTRPPTDPDFLQPKTFLFGSETHGGEDVALYGTGPGSALVSGTLEQNSIFHIMVSALGWR
jgi:alkaline phosphatase